MVIGAHTSTYRLDRQAFKRGPSSLYNVMYIAQTIRFACLFVPSTEYALSRLSLPRSFDAVEEKAKKTITLTHIRSVQFIDAIVAVSTHFDELFAYISSWHWVLSWSSYSSLSHCIIFFSPRSSAFDSKEKSYCFFARAHRLTEPNHWTINTNETENNNCYYLDIIFLRKKNTNWLNANHKM